MFIQRQISSKNWLKMKINICRQPQFKSQHPGRLRTTLRVMAWWNDLTELLVGHVVGLRILSSREMVFTLCLILILDPFFSMNTMPLADF